MFQPNIVSLCDEEQQARWLPLCRDWRMIGCYAQTELGHGSNIRALETTATFLPESKGGDQGGSWIINSPTLTSGKFWPGTLGRTANVSLPKHKTAGGKLRVRFFFFLILNSSLVLELNVLDSMSTAACYGDCPIDRWERKTPRNP